MAIKHAFNNTKSDGADATLTRPGNWNAAHTIDPISLTPDMLWTATKYPARTVSVANIASKSGLVTNDGVTHSSGDVIWLTAQTAGAENGPWLVRSGTWVRPLWFPAATAFSLVEREQHTFTVWDGTAYAGTQWRSSLTAGTTYTIDTDALTYVQVKTAMQWFANVGRVYAEFSDTATPSNRMYWQSAPGGVIGATGNTLLGCLPSGTATTAVMHFYNNSDPAAVGANFGRIGMIGTDFRLVTGLVGAGTHPSLSFSVNGTVRQSFNVIGDIILGPANTFPSYSATTNFAQLFLGNDQTIAYSTDAGAGRELDITQNGYLNTGVWKYRESDYASQIRMVSGSVRFNYVASGTSGNTITWATGMMVSNTGHVLIGSTTDDGVNALQVTGSMTMTGALKGYNGTTTSDFGQPVIVYSKLFTAQTAAIAATNLIASLAATGMYRIGYNMNCTRAATSSSTLGGTNGFQAIFTDPADSVAKTTRLNAQELDSANSTGKGIGGTRHVYAKAATALQFSCDYTSSGVTTMQFDLYITVEYLGPCAA